MADPRLLRRLDQISTRLRRQRLFAVAALGWGALALLIMLLLSLGAREAARWTLLTGLIAVPALAQLLVRPRPGDRLRAALEIEKTFPELDSRLITAVQQQPKTGTWNFSFLQTELLGQVFAQLRRQDWHRAVGRRWSWLTQIAHALALLVCLLIGRQLLMETGQNLLHPGTAATHAPQTAWHVTVEPGHTEIERGGAVVVTARFDGQLPAEAELVTIDSGHQERRYPLTRSLSDPVFGGRIPDVTQDLKYRIEYAHEHSPDYQVTTFEYPALVQADAEVLYPTYTRLQPKSLKDVRRITVVEGSQLDLTCLWNKPVRSARLVPKTGTPVELQPQTGVTPASVTRLTPAQPGETIYELELEDDQGRTNRDAAEIRLTVVPNRTPDLKVAFPARDLRVSSLQELLVQAEAADDFGLQSLGVVYQLPDGQEHSLALHGAAGPDVKTSAQHLLSMEGLSVRPDDLVSYCFYADDVGPDGQLRRSFSDLFFAEVRPFEEIFRQVPPQRGEGESAAGKLLELQRQVVSGTWNVMREHSSDPPGAEFAKQIKTLHGSQGEISKMTSAVRARLSDALLREYASQAMEFMQKAQKEFQNTRKGPTTAPLPAARDAAQQAYRTLLKMEAREKQVQQAQGQGQPSAADRQMDQQLNALKLKNDRDRYETERQAKAKQSAAARETQQILSRLRELARRQEDLNNRVRELETALRNAETEQEKNALHAQLRRLQEEQRELLQDLDHVRERMNQDQNRERMLDARQQADATRERVQRTSEALQAGRTDQAVTEGSRAARDLQRLEEELRSQAAGQFDQQLRDLQNQVRTLADQERELGRQIAPDDSASRPTDGRPRLEQATTPSDKDLDSRIKEQQTQLTQTLDQARQLVEASEEAEPLLSKTLYETLRDLRQSDPEAALRQVARLNRQGLPEEAAHWESQAQAGIDRLQQGVDDAAEHLLGNETAALQLAQSELQELTESIRRELDAHAPPPGSETPSDPGQQQSGQQQSGQQQSGQQQSGQQQSGQQQSGQQQSGQQQSGQQQSGQQQSGQQQSGQQQSGQQQSGQQQSGQQQSGQQQSGQQQSGQQQSGQQQANQGKGSPRSIVDSLQQLLNSPDSPGGGSESGGLGAPVAPLTGGTFVEWSDRMRNVEEMLTTARLKSQAAAIRDRARLERMEVKRHSKKPDWKLVRTSIYGPLRELQNEIAEELARRNPQEQLVPIDRDPVPEQYSEQVKEYYRQLSRQPEQ